MAERLSLHPAGKAGQQEIHGQKDNKIEQDGQSQAEEQGKNKEPVHQRADGHQQDLEKPDRGQTEAAERPVAGAAHQVAMFPQALQGAEGPAETLPGQGGPGFRRLGPGNGMRRIADPVAGAVQAEGQVGILGQGVAADAARGHDRRAAPDAGRAGHHGDAVELLIGAPVQVEAAGVFQVLKPGHGGPQVPDLDMAGHGPHFFIAHLPQQLRDRIRLEKGVSIQGDNNFMGRCLKSGAQSPGLAQVGLADELQTALFGGDAGGLASIVRRLGHGAGQLFHGGGNLLHCGRLFAGPLGNLLGAAGQGLAA